MDYELLRQKGLNSLQALSARSWTDHNIHDPGITILEALCYALTELGNRINLPIEDILTSQPGVTPKKLQEVFPLAQTILPNCAWTEKDLRKVLVDLASVQNVYLQKATQAEQEIFYDDLAKSLTYTPSVEPVQLNGLYIMKLELAPSVNFGDLNTNILNRSIQVNPGSGNVDFEVFVTVPYWDEAEDTWLEPGPITDIIITNPVSHVADPQITNFFGELTIEVNNTALIQNFTLDVRIDPPIDPVDIALLNAVNAALQVLATDITAASVFSTYKGKLEEINTVVRFVEEEYHKHRNLCEDLLRIEAVRTQEIAVFTTIELAAGADPNKILANIYFELDQFLCPRLKWYSLQELLDQKDPKLRLDEILEGPLLKNGFIRNEDLDTLIREDIVYTSDLIRLIMAIEGVFSVNELTISNFIDNILVSGNTPEPNCLKLIDTNKYKPKFSALKSGFLFERNGVVVETEPVLVAVELEALIQASALTPGTADLGLDIPKGDLLDLEQFHSVQHEFPATYGIGRNRVSSSASPQRIAKAKQLRAYLAFFDQLMANFSSQMANLCNFYAPDESIDQTYYNLPLYNVPGIDQLLLGFINSGLSFENFKADVNNSYISKLSEFFESNEVFLDRRNRLLDHLLARIGESFPDAASLEYAGLNLYLIQDKIRFYKKHPELNGCRGRAYDIHPVSGGAQVWDTDEISGLQKRLSLLMGIEDPQRKDLTTEPDPTNHFTFSNVGPDFAFELSDEDSNTLVVSINYPSQNQAETAARLLIKLGINANSFGTGSIQNIGSEDFLVAPIMDISLTILAHARILYDPSLSQEVQRQNLINKVKNNLLQIHKTGEGFFLLEHLLIRPVRNDSSNVDEFLPAVFHSQKNFPIKDPYSFRMSFVFPSGYERNFNNPTATPAERTWSFRYRSKAFREFLSRIIREETPAHIQPEIFFLDHNTQADSPTTPSLGNFQNIFRNWLTILRDAASTQTDLSLAQNQLIDVMEEIINP